MQKSAVLWLAIGWIGYALLPWYMGDSAGVPTEGWFESSLALGWRNAPWLIPIAIPLLAALVPLLRRQDDPRSPGWLVWLGLVGLIWITIEGFAIGHRGWSGEWLALLFGDAGPKQGGMGWGAFATFLAFLMLFCHGLAGRGLCRGDAFTLSSIGLILALITVFVFFPVMKILFSAFQDNAGHFAPSEFLVKSLDRSIWGVDCVYSDLRCGVAWNTLFLGLLVGLGSTVLGLAFALIATRTNFALKGSLRALTILSIITPPFVIGLAVILLFGRSGMVTTFLFDWFDVPPTRWIYGLPGVFLAQLLAFTPIAFMVLIAVVQGISPSLEEASQTLRAKSWTTFRTISLPLMRPGLANAFLLCFLESLADFGNPLVLGGNFEVLSTKIFFAVVGSAHDQGRAAMLAIILLVFTLGAFYAQHRWLGNRSYVTVTGKGDAGLPLPLPGRIAWLSYGTALPWAAFTLAIYATILIGGFVKTLGRDYTPTLQHYLTAFSVERTAAGLHFTGSAWISFWTTIEVSAIAAPLTTIIGLLCAYLLTRQTFVGRRAFEFGAMLSFAIPGTVVGVSYILAFNVPPIEITGTGLILVICFVFRNMPVGVRSGIATMSQIDKSLDEASLTLGARSFTTIRRVILPLLRPAIVATMVYSFVRAMTAVSAVIFLVSAEYNMATAYIVGRVEGGEFGLAIAYSSVLIVVMLIAIGLIQVAVGQRRLGRRTAAAIAVQGAG